MMSEEPPRWLQRTLVHFLNARDRETIPGDLLEEYREGQLPNVGSAGAKYWYLRQIMSFASIRAFGGPLLKQLLVLTSIMVMAAGAWLAVMEKILQHEGYVGRSGVALCIALQGLATLLLVLMDGGAPFRQLIIAGAVAILLLGGSAVVRILHLQHFEGFVLLVGLALIVQGALTLAILLQTRYRAAN